MTKGTMGDLSDSEILRPSRTSHVGVGCGKVSATPHLSLRPPGSTVVRGEGA